MRFFSTEKQQKEQEEDDQGVVEQEAEQDQQPEGTEQKVIAEEQIKQEPEFKYDPNTLFSIEEARASHKQVQNFQRILYGILAPSVGLLYYLEHPNMAFVLGGASLLLVLGDYKKAYKHEIIMSIKEDPEDPENRIILTTDKSTKNMAVEDLAPGFDNYEDGAKAAIRFEQFLKSPRQLLNFGKNIDDSGAETDQEGDQAKDQEEEEGEQRPRKNSMQGTLVGAQFFKLTEEQQKEFIQAQRKRIVSFWAHHMTRYGTLKKELEESDEGRLPEFEENDDIFHCFFLDMTNGEAPLFLYCNFIYPLYFDGKALAKLIRRSGKSYYAQLDDGEANSGESEQD